MKIRETWVARVKKVVVKDVANKHRVAIRKTISQPDSVRVPAMNLTMIWMKDKAALATTKAANDARELSSSSFLLRTMTTNVVIVLLL
jgi:hypothetical protein